MAEREKSGFRQLGAAGPLAIAVATIPPVGGMALVALVPKIAPWLRQYPLAGGVGYVVGSTLLIGLALVPTLSTSILAGWAFGMGWGFVAAMSVMTLAGLLGYAVARLAARERVLAFIRARPRWNALYEGLLNEHAGKTGLTIVLLRVPPLAPMAMANYVLGAVRVNVWTYLWATVVGMTPRTLMAVFAAAQMEQLTFKGADRPGMRVAGIVLSLVAMGAIGVMARRALHDLRK